MLPSHELTEEFPDKADTIHLLKLSDPRFCRLATVYDDVNSAIHRYEENLEATSDDHLADLKKRRLALLDEIQVMLA